MRKLIILTSCFFHFSSYVLAEEVREVLVPIRGGFSPDATQNVLNKPVLEIKMILDEESETKYKIPKNIVEFDEMLKIALGEGYGIYVERFSDFICNKLPLNDLFSSESFYNLIGFLNNAWMINSENSPANKILGANYVFYDVEDGDAKIYSIFAKIYDDRHKDKVMERWPTYCSPYYYK